MKLLEDRAPEFCTEREIEAVFGGTTNARAIIHRLRRKGIAIESATAARSAEKLMPPDAKGYRFEV